MVYMVTCCVHFVPVHQSKVCWHGSQLDITCSDIQVDVIFFGFRSPIQAGKEAVVEFEVTASNAAKPLRSVVVSFLSKELTGVKGMMTFSITKRDVESVSDANTSS